MAAFPAASATQASASLGQHASLLGFLRRELAPLPGRAIAPCRVVVACVTVVVVCMTLRVPEAHLATWIVFKISLEESGETLLTGIVALVAVTIGLAIALVLLFVSMDQPWLRFCLIGAMAAVALFLRRTFVIGTFGFVLGLISTVVLTTPDFLPVTDLLVHLKLWL